MTYRLISLSKFLQVAYAERRRQIKVARADIRSELRKERGGPKGDGGDFYLPFWADAKTHVAGGRDIRDASEERMARNKGRKRLYPELTRGFLLWWDEKRRRRNEPFRLIAESVRARHEIADLGVLKVENTLAFSIGEDAHRIVYPYLCEEPDLSNEAARLGLWVMSQCIGSYDVDDLRILDVMRGNVFSTADVEFRGDEDTILRARYTDALSLWDELRAEYP